MNVTKYKLMIGATVLSLILALVGFGKTPTETQKLSLNQALNREIRGDETQTFVFNLNSGDYAHIEVKQKMLLSKF